MTRIPTALALYFSVVFATSGHLSAQPASSTGDPGPPTPSGSPGYSAPDVGSVSINPPPAVTGTPPPSFPASTTATSQRIEELMRGAGVLVARGELSKSMEVYNEVLMLAPRYAQAYRARALALAQLGDRVRAQMDYIRYLQFDPQARDRSLDELQLFEQSGYVSPGEVESAANDYGPTTLGYDPGPRVIDGWVVPGSIMYRVYSPAQQADLKFTMARDAFASGHYANAYRWAQLANQAVPSARAHAMMAQILLAQRAYHGAASEARAAVALGPMSDWSTVYGYYDYATGAFARNMRRLQEYVRENPSVADARFLLGYQHLILGQTELGHAQLAIAAVLEPSDVVAQSLLTRDGVEIVRSERGVAQSGQPSGRSIAQLVSAAKASRRDVGASENRHAYQRGAANQ